MFHPPPSQGRKHQEEYWSPGEGSCASQCRRWPFPFSPLPLFSTLVLVTNNTRLVAVGEHLTKISTRKLASAFFAPWSWIGWTSSHCLGRLGNSDELGVELGPSWSAALCSLDDCAMCRWEGAGVIFVFKPLYFNTAMPVLAIERLSVLWRRHFCHLCV